MINYVFKIAASVVSLYSFLCFLRIILTWIPNFSYSKPAQFLADICDPYMNLFRGIRWLRMGSFDFSPALALCILGALSSLLRAIAYGGSLSIGTILAVVLQIVFSIISSLVTFIIIVFAVRLIVLLLNRNYYNTGSYMLDQIDSSISPLAYRIARTFLFGKTITYKAALIISIISLGVTLMFLNILSAVLISFIANLPF